MAILSLYVCTFGGKIVDKNIINVLALYVTVIFFLKRIVKAINFNFISKETVRDKTKKKEKQKINWLEIRKQRG